jgi:hypothetical protein
MPDELQISDRVYLRGGLRRGVVCGIVAAGLLTGQPRRYRVAWDCAPPCPPELDPAGVWDRQYSAEELTRIKPKGE